MEVKHMDLELLHGVTLVEIIFNLDTFTVEHRSYFVNLIERPVGLSIREEKRNRPRRQI